LGTNERRRKYFGFSSCYPKKYPLRSRAVTQIDTLLTKNLVFDMRIWRRGVKNFIFKEFLPSSPLCNPITIFQIYEYSHFTILLVENDHNYYYDSLGKNNHVAEIFPRIHTALQFSYEDNYEAFPLILRNLEPKVIRQTCLFQRDKWSCGIHMLLITLATIYQGKKPDLYYTREDTYLFSQALLHHQLSGELL